ncbi:hypothetical protein QR680_006110 [Steinernema hermaphroditum]|uniref:Uncharacterized protein n=1 Tax=Steinernema hermaphroditum TaxID=289476 RepID=A0AA39LVZ9_9BILA|nr:hypothetical protein QR680_006110 [Steinernema hermaphroditum]
MESTTSKHQRLHSCKTFNYDELLQVRWKLRLEQIEMQKRAAPTDTDRLHGEGPYSPIYNKRQSRFPEPVRVENLQKSADDDFDCKTFRRFS